jgi:hypothetical protein
MTPEKALPADWNTEIKRLRQIAPPTTKAQLYQYLKGAYRLMRRIPKLNPTIKRQLNALADTLGGTVEMNRARLIIELTIKSNVISNKMRWKYSIVLLSARSQGIHSRDFIDFLAREKINGCVDKYQARQKRKSDS